MAPNSSIIGQKLTSIKKEDMASVIPKIASSTKERKVQLHLPIMGNTRKVHIPKVIPTYVAGTTHPIVNLLKQRKLHDQFASLQGVLKDFLGLLKGL